ncbi:MAG: signal peptidase II [Bacteriovoracia bacterium]
MSNIKKISIFSFIIVALIVIDQLTKKAIMQNFFYGETYKVIPGFFSLAFVKNTGAAFGFGAGGPEWFRQVFFLALPVLFCGWVAFLLYKSLKGPLYMSLAYSLIIAGAIGNLIDRFALGFVVDMFMFYWMKEENHFHVFNVADSCITIAAGLLILDYIKNLRANKEVKAQQG